jgi:hypothetical protein
VGKTPKPRSEPNRKEIDKPEEDSWENDQKKHGYYYDDAYGYEEFDPEQVEDDED